MRNDNNIFLFVMMVLDTYILTVNSVEKLELSENTKCYGILHMHCVRLPALVDLSLMGACHHDRGTDY